MTEATDMNLQEIHRRLLFILHEGLVEMRLLALGQVSQQISDLADTLEIIPGLIDAWEDDHLDLIRSILKTYQDKYGSKFDYLSYLETDPPPDRF
jgi:hypothetical protein